MGEPTDIEPRLSVGAVSGSVTHNKGMIRALASQAAMGLLASLVSLLVGGVAAGASALIGAGAYFLPNALFTLLLLTSLLGGKKLSLLILALGEALKLGSAALLLGLAAYYGRDWLVWPALLAGLLCTLNGYMLLLAFRKLL